MNDAILISNLIIKYNIYPKGKLAGGAPFCMGGSLGVKIGGCDGMDSTAGVIGETGPVDELSEGATGATGRTDEAGVKGAAGIDGGKAGA